MSDELNERDAEPGTPDPAESNTPSPNPGSSLISRRRALQVLGASAVALGIGEAQQPQQPQVPVNPPATPSTPATGAPQPPAGHAKRKFFNGREWRIAGVLADDIIPRDERSGSATEAGVLEYIDFHMSVPETTDEARVAMHGGLRWIDTESRKRFGVGYDRAKTAQRHQILDDIAVPASQARPEMRAGAAFFNSFRGQVGAGFFSSAIGWKDLRYEGNVFNPNWNGCPPEATRKLGVSYEEWEKRKT